jgi:hypothetical protein
MSLLFEEKIMQGVQGVTTTKKVPVLAEDCRNGADIANHVDKVFKTVNGLHFLLPSFNKSTTECRGDEQDQIYKYAQQIRQRQAKYLQVKQEEERKGDGGKPPEEVVLTEEEKTVLKMVAERRPRYQQGGFGDVQGPEDVDTEKLRYKIFDYLSLIIEPHFKHHLESVQQGNLKELNDVIMSLAKKRPVQDYAERLRAVSGSLTSLAHSYPVIQKAFMEAHSTFVNTNMTVEELLVPFLLLSFDGDMRYKTAADRIRRQHESEPLPLLAVLRQFSLEHQRIEDGERSKAKANAVASTKKFQAKMAKTQKDTEEQRICFNFRDKGFCRFGDDCAFRHAGHAAKPVGHATKPVARKCWRCGSEKHVVADCPIKPEEMAKLQANLAKTAIAPEPAAPAQPGWEAMPGSQ